MTMCRRVYSLSVEPVPSLSRSSHCGTLFAVSKDPPTTPQCVKGFQYFALTSLALDTLRRVLCIFTYGAMCSINKKKKIQSAAFGVPEYEMNREGTYRPRISPEHLRQLWKTKQEIGKPKTAQHHRAVRVVTPEGIEPATTSWKDKSLQG